MLTQFTDSHVLAVIQKELSRKRSKWELKTHIHEFISLLAVLIEIEKNATKDKTFKRNIFHT